MPRAARKESSSGIYHVIFHDIGVAGVSVGIVRKFG